MNTIIKPMLWAGLGLVTLAGVSSVQAKEPVKVSVAENTTLNGHYELEVVYETQTDEYGNEHQVRVERRVWVNDGPFIGFRLGFGSYDNDYHHRYHDYDRRHGSDYQHRR